MKKILSAALTVLIFSQCNKLRCDCIAIEPFVLNQPFTMLFGNDYEETQTGKPLQLTMNQIISDSRCPSDAVCVWEGRVEVTLILQQDGETRQDTMSLPGLIDPAFPVQDTSFFQGYSIILQAVSPYPTSTNAGSIPQNMYQLKMLVQKN